MEQERKEIDRTAFDYAWGWFTLHAAQRMQSANFFLVAVAFLGQAYVAAVISARPGLAAGVASIGAISTLSFYRVERRVRGLVHAAEEALQQIEERIAHATEIPQMKIVSIVEGAPAGTWAYSKAFQILYGAVGVAFCGAIVYAIAKKFR